MKFYHFDHRMSKYKIFIMIATRLRILRLMYLFYLCLWCIYKEQFWSFYMYLFVFFSTLQFHFFCWSFDSITPCRSVYVIHLYLCDAPYFINICMNQSIFYGHNIHENNIHKYNFSVMQYSSNVEFGEEILMSNF